ERFEGETYHTARWPEAGVDLRGKRGGVGGTGSSAMQSITIFAAQAAWLGVFQRTPAYSVPAGNRPLDPEEQRRVKARYAEFRREAAQQPFGAAFGFGAIGAFEGTPAEREREYEERWRRGGLPYMAAFRDLMLDPAANETAAEFVRAKIRATVGGPRGG